MNFPSNSDPYAVLSHVPQLKPVFDSKAVRNLLNPDVRLVGAKWGGVEPVGSYMLAAKGWYSGYQNSLEADNLRDIGEPKLKQFNDEVFRVRPGDLIAMASNKVVSAIGIVLYHIDIESPNTELVDGRHGVLRLFKVDWVSTNLNIELDQGGPFSPRQTITSAVKLSQLYTRVETHQSQAVRDSYSQFLTEIEKARVRFFRNNLDLTPKAY